MKRLILISLFIFPLFISAQNYIPIPCDSTSEWRILQQGHTGSNCLINIDLRYFITGDTLINNLYFKKLYETGIQYENPMGPTYTCNTTVYHFHNIYVGAIRNDSEKVYFLLAGSNAELLLYDFALNVGDTVPGKYNINKVSIQSIDSVLINGFFHKRFNLDNGHWNIEGIGSDIGLIEPSGTTFGFSLQFLCYAENHIPIFPVGTNCILNVNIEENLKATSYNDLIIYPNPANNKITFDFKDFTKAQILDIEIYNAVGMKVKRVHFNTNSQTKTINIKDFNSGIYYYRIILKTTKFQVYSGKFVKM